MAAHTSTSVLRRPAAERRAFDRRLARILDAATQVICEKGYEGSSLRDLSRATGMSLAGLYYYFESKEKLLYLIQKHAFTTIVERLKQRLGGVRDPEARVRVFIANHLEYFLANQQAMKVLTHEDEVLTGNYAEEVCAIKRAYYRICRQLVEELRAARGVESSRRRGASERIAVLSLFGMMNWIYTWHNPRVDDDAGALAGQMADVFLRGILAGAARPPVRQSKNSRKRS